MSDEWKNYPSAPTAGTMICVLSQIPVNGVFSIDLSGFPIILAQRDGQVFAYVNACPHQFLPLDYRSKSVLSADGQTLRCTNHEAGFDLATGKGIDGFGIGCKLEPIPLRVADDGIVRVGD